MKTKLYFIHLLYSIPFFLLWFICICLIYFAYSEGFLSAIPDAFGNIFTFILCLFGFFAFMSAFLLPFFVRKEWKRQSTSFALTILFFMCGILSANVGEKKFKEFTHEAWMTYPSHRITMIENLLEKYEIDGQNRKTIEVLLGNPDKVCEDGTYFYDSMHGNGVYVEFKNDTVSDIYYIA